MPVAKPKQQRIPKSNTGRIQNVQDAARGSAAILEYMRERDYKPNDIWLQLYLKRVRAQYAIYANDQLKVRGVYIPVEMLSNPPAGTIYLRLTSPFS